VKRIQIRFISLISEKIFYRNGLTLVTTKPSLGGNNDVIPELLLPRGSLVSDIPAGDGKLVNLFLLCIEHKEEVQILYTCQ
jgi:hypothetical protein